MLKKINIGCNNDLKMCIFDFDLTLTLITYLCFINSKTNRGESAFSGFFITLFYIIYLI